MTTLTIDIPDKQAEEVISQLKSLGVNIRHSNLEVIDNLTEEDYKKDFKQRAQINRDRLRKDQ